VHCSRLETACLPRPSARQRVVQTLVAQRCAATRYARQHLPQRQPAQWQLCAATASADQYATTQLDAPTNSADAEDADLLNGRRSGDPQTANGQSTSSGAAIGSANGSVSGKAEARPGPAGPAAEVSDGSSGSAAQAEAYEQPSAQTSGAANGAVDTASGEASAQYLCQVSGL